MSDPVPLFPPLRRSTVVACQLSQWYPLFAPISIKTVTIRPLPPLFRAFLDADGVHIPQGAQDPTTSSSLSDDDDDDDDDDDPPRQHFAFPELDSRIRATIAEFGAVFPKLNWTAPKDAAWMLPQSSPLKCTSPADVYLLLKSSDFVNHDLDIHTIFDGCESQPGEEITQPELELSLRKWYAIDKSREFRCFVRSDVLLAISQRDTNYYPYLNDTDTQAQIRNTITDFWQRRIRIKWPGGGHYVFDVLLTRDLAGAHLVDINPYAPQTDSLLLSYQRLQQLARSAASLPELAVIDSASHPDAARNAPAFQHNMFPREALEISSGRLLEDFNQAWAEEIRKASADTSDSHTDSD